MFVLVIERQEIFNFLFLSEVVLSMPFFALCGKSGEVIDFVSERRRESVFFGARDELLYGCSTPIACSSSSQAIRKPAQPIP